MITFLTWNLRCFSKLTCCSEKKTVLSTIEERSCCSRSRSSYKQIRRELNTFNEMDQMRSQFDGPLSRSQNMVFYLCDYFVTKTEVQQHLPSWKGFYTLTSPADMDNRVVGYLPSIGQSPTKMETASNLSCSAKKLSNRGWLEIDASGSCHAIYVKPLQCLLQKENQELCKLINFKMGGCFNAPSIFLGLIGEYFGDGGLKDFAVEVGIIG